MRRLHRHYWLVAAGGAVGASLRWVISFFTPASADGIHWELVAINVVGSLALGVLVGHYEGRDEPEWYPAIGPGVLGGFTTYSAAATAQIALDANATTAVATLAIMLPAAAAAAAAGWAWADRMRAVRAAR